MTEGRPCFYCNLPESTAYVLRDCPRAVSTGSDALGDEHEPCMQEAFLVSWIKMQPLTMETRFLHFHLVSLDTLDLHRFSFVQPNRFLAWKPLPDDWCKINTDVRERLLASAEWGEAGNELECLALQPEIGAIIWVLWLAWEKRLQRMIIESDSIVEV
ncbi:hypothetical protein Nepgr_018269 [Nepenthes gracilis]|uniref:Uncharacterized protein n=1 Tax=Nepenthes gracilis TaxID=150966 RepID=A0AAD3SR00_NEPGR|nr:hypothetical protein Nepgr_018269 [Nepenthes gracilis]